MRDDLIKSQHQRFDSLTTSKLVINSDIIFNCRHETKNEDPLQSPPSLLLAEPGARSAQTGRRRRADVAPRAARRRSAPAQAAVAEPPQNADDGSAARATHHRQQLEPLRGRHALAAGLHGTGGGTGRHQHHEPSGGGRFRGLFDGVERHDRDRVLPADTQRAHIRRRLLSEGQDADERERRPDQEEERERTDAQQHLRRFR